MYLKTTTNTLYFHVDSVQIDVIDLPSITIKPWFEPLPDGLVSTTLEEWEKALNQLCQKKISMEIAAD